mgnify:CR=1 FL=1
MTAEGDSTMTPKSPRKPQLLSESVQEEPAKPALGSPHDGFAAVLLTLVLALVYFGFGTGRLLTEAEDGLWWIPLALLAVLAPLIWFSMKYLFRAHGWRERGGGFPAVPALSMYAAFGAMVMFILPLLASVFETWWGFGLTCLVLAALTMAPVQTVLSRDPNRHSGLTA